MKNLRLLFPLALLAVTPLLMAQDRSFGVPTLADSSKAKVDVNDVAVTKSGKSLTGGKAASKIDIDAPAVDDESLKIVIDLIEDDRILNGVLLDTNNLIVETAFGPASIPLVEVLGIRLSRSATEITTVVLHNGDMITGQVNIRTLMIRTNWGKSEVNGSNLASIFFRKGLAWKSLDLLAGPRWTLVEVEPGDSATKKPRSQTLAAQ